MLQWFRRRFGPVPRSATPRMPSDEREADRVFGSWDGRNARYYFVADVALRGAGVVADVTFDTDTNVAVRVGRGRVPADLQSRTVHAVLPVSDRTGARLAAEEVRAAFRRRHDRPGADPAVAPDPAT